MGEFRHVRMRPILAVASLLINSTQNTANFSFRLFGENKAVQPTENQPVGARRSSGCGNGTTHPDGDDTSAVALWPSR